MRIGITGGIGSGKSFICDEMRKYGFRIYNCDDEAKRLMVEDQNIVNSLKKIIGDEAYSSDNKLNKAAIAKFLFSNNKNAQRINAIVHPAVKKDFLRWAKEIENSTEPNIKKIPIMESAILYESHFEDVVDKVVLIWAEEQTRLKRAMERDNTSQEAIKARMSSQLPGKELLKRADYVFNHEDYSTTNVELQKLLNYIEKNT
jgi:dephospho-CoA kinase